MKKAVLLDTGVLSLVSNPKPTGEPSACADWLQALLSNDRRVCIPEICDYELRRELVRATLTKAVTRLDQLKDCLTYLPIETAVMLKAAELWARARNMRCQTAKNEALDADMILVAQAKIAEAIYGGTVIATTNVKHLSRFAEANPWRAIDP